MVEHEIPPAVQVDQVVVVAITTAAIPLAVLVHLDKDLLVAHHQQ
jgi:hypothetical protein